MRRDDGPSKTRQPGPGKGDTLRAIAAHAYNKVTPWPARAMHWKALRYVVGMGTVVAGVMQASRAPAAVERYPATSRARVAIPLIPP